jgi:hypothetical protein
MPAWLLLDTAEGPVQRQLRRVESLNGLDAQSRHAGIKARNRGNEKREEKPGLARATLPPMCS